MDKETCAYAAGFFDGEGYVGIGSGGRLEIRVVNTYLLTLEFLKSKWGGNIYHRNTKSPKHTQAHDWVITKKIDVINFINDIYPFLQVKKERTDFILDFLREGS